MNWSLQLRTLAPLLHYALDTIGFNFLDISHVEERRYYLLFFECPGVHNICHFNLILPLALNFNFSLVLYGDIVAKQAQWLLINISCSQAELARLYKRTLFKLLKLLSSLFLPKNLLSCQCCWCLCSLLLLHDYWFTIYHFEIRTACARVWDFKRHVHASIVFIQDITMASLREDALFQLSFPFHLIILMIKNSFFIWFWWWLYLDKLAWIGPCKCLVGCKVVFL